MEETPGGLAASAQPFQPTSRVSATARPFVPGGAGRGTQDPPRSAGIAASAAEFRPAAGDRAGPVPSQWDNPTGGPAQWGTGPSAVAMGHVPASSAGGGMGGPDFAASGFAEASFGVSAGIWARFARGPAPLTPMRPGRRLQAEGMDGGADITAPLSVQPRPERRTLQSQFIPPDLEDHFRQQVRPAGVAWRGCAPQPPPASPPHRRRVCLLSCPPAMSASRRFREGAHAARAAPADASRPTPRARPQLHLRQPAGHSGLGAGSAQRVELRVPHALVQGLPHGSPPTHGLLPPAHASPAPSQVVSVREGHTYALRRIDKARTTLDIVSQAFEMWQRAPHPNMVPLRASFVHQGGASRRTPWRFAQPPSPPHLPPLPRGSAVFRPRLLSRRPDAGGQVPAQPRPPSSGGSPVVHHCAGRLRTPLRALAPHGRARGLRTAHPRHRLPPVRAHSAGNMPPALNYPCPALFAGCGSPTSA